MRVLWSLLLLVLFSLPTWSAADSWVLKAALCVHEPAITLGDLVQAQGPRAEEVLQSLGHEPVLAAPKFQGARATLHGARLRDLIIQRWGSTLPPITAPPRVQVQRGGQVVETQTLYPAIDKILTKGLDLYGGDVELRDYRLADYFFLNTQEEVQLRISPVGSLAPGRISLRFEALNQAGEVVQSFTGTVFADVWKTVPCAARVLNRGDVLVPDLVTFARKNLAYLPREPWDGQGLPLRMTGPVGEGQPITMAAVEQIPLMSKGQIVTMVYSGAVLKLSVPAEILEEGGLGARVRVRNVQSKKIVVARIIDEQTVQVP